MGKTGIDILVSFDTTGSMYPCLTQVRRNVVDFVRRVFKDIPNLRIAVIAHGDYYDRNETYVIKVLDFTSDQEEVCDFIRNVEPTDGGDAPECYEKVLNRARALNWQAGKSKVLVMIGDDVPHEPDYRLNTNNIDWKNELSLLLEMGINVYGVHAMPGIRRHSKWFYKEIAKRTNGYYLTLDQFAAVRDIIYAICYKQAGAADLQNFQQEVQQGRRMNRNMASVFQTLGGERVVMDDVDEGLVPVPAGRFQIIDVDVRQGIRDFVNDQGLNFKQGRGFYEFMKSEMIQERKEVVLMDNQTGDMFSGAKAREMIGLPYGNRARMKPTDVPGYTVFVQSTSWNRKLIPDTRFLYEVEDWGRFM